MKITRDNQGWRIEPVTSDEEAFFQLLLDALRKAYGGVSVASSSDTQENTGSEND